MLRSWRMMAHLKVGGILEATIDRINNSGNAIIEGDDGESFALLKTGDWEEDDTITVKITAKQGDTYTAVPMSEEAGASAPPLHHDGQSAGKTRRMDDAFASIEEREFNPQIHGAPELGKNYTPPEPKRSSNRETGKSLQQIAKDMGITDVTEKQRPR